MLSQVSKRFANIGFIGLGNMGGPMARNLALNGDHNLTVFDVSQERIDWLKDQCSSVTAAPTPADVAADNSILVTMLPSNPHVKSVYLGDDGILKTAKKGSVFLDCSTIDPNVAREVASQVEKASSKYLDAPVSGGVTAASAGTLTFMVGNDSPAVFDTAHSVLQHMGKNVVSITGIGNGQVAKICNNMMLGISMIGISETMNLGIKLGIDKKQLADIINVSSGRCWSSDTYNPVPEVIPGVPSSNNWNGGFGSALMTKDLGLAQDAAASVNAQTPLGAQSLQIYRMLCANGYAGKDFGSIYHYFSKQTSTDPTSK